MSGELKVFRSTEGGDFRTWLRSLYRQGAILIPSICAAFSMFAAVATQITRVFDKPWFAAAMFGFHLLTCGALLFLIPKPRADIRISRRASTAIEQFLQTWEMVWFSWVLLYLVFTAKAAEPLLHWTLPDPYWDALLDFCNNLQTVCFMMCYIVLTKSTVDVRRAQSRLPWPRAVAVLAVVGVAEVFIAMAMSHALMVTDLSTTLGMIPTVLKWVSGIGAGVSMALVIGRLDSRFINPPTLCMVALYLYAIIQPGWPAFGDPRIRLVLVTAALVLKCLFFIMVAWLLQSGVMLFYLDRMAYLLVNVDSDRKSYLERLSATAHPGESRDAKSS